MPVEVHTASRWLLPLVIFALTVLVFLPSFQNSFVNWDDPANLLENPFYRGLSWSHLHWMFTTFHLSLYRPLTWMTFGIDYLIWGMEPFGYHLTSVLLHSANAVLFYFVSVQLFQLATVSKNLSELSLRLAAGLAALFFSLHPLRVEAVAWASARNDVLSAFFFLWAVFCYLHYAALPTGEERRRWWFATALIVYVLSLLAKASTVSLPIVLFALDVYPLRRLGAGPINWFDKERRQVWSEKLLFLVPAVCAAITAFAAKYELGSMASVTEAGLAARIAQSLYGLFFYVWNTLMPLDLSPLYELPRGLSLGNDEVIISGVIVLAVSVVLVAAARKWPAGLASWVYYVVIVAPVLGIFQSGPQLAADRYSYLSCLGFANLAGASLIYFRSLWQAGRIGVRTFQCLHGLPVLILIAFGALIWSQVQIWRDSETLWRHAVAIMPSAIPHYNLAVSLAAVGKLDEAIEQFRKTLALNPSYDNADYNLAKLLANRGELSEAAQHYRRAAELNPKDGKIYGDLGLLLAKQGRVEEAVRDFRQALSLSPSDSEILFNLANILAGQGKLEEASAHFKEAVRIRPDFAEAYHNLGRVVAAQGHLDEAIDHFRRALENRPEFAEAHQSLGSALAEQGKRDEAVRHYQEAARILNSRRESGASR